MNKLLGERVMDRSGSQEESYRHRVLRDFRATTALY